MGKPIIGITIGDIAGVGPEIVVKALRDNEVYNACNPVVIGNRSVLEKIMGLCNINVSINQIDIINDAKFEYGTIDLINVEDIDADDIKFGQIQAIAGKAAYEFIKKATEMALIKEIHAIATAPINKEALKSAGINLTGHTEILANLCGVDNPLTMFQVQKLRVFFYTRHLSLRKAIDAIKKDRIYDFILRCNSSLKRLGIENPRLVVAALNPHGGEHGLFGDEEMIEIEPAIKKAKENGVDVTGPIAADSVFYLAMKGNYDAAISLYHDQGHIATKMFDFEKTVSITLGLPFIRTSVDHGTAFDIAGKNIASPVSMKEAILLAADYVMNYKYEY